MGSQRKEGSECVLEIFICLCVLLFYILGIEDSWSCVGGFGFVGLYIVISIYNVLDSGFQNVLQTMS
ncbi:unnamed protein product [Malus baccata var. baccata]